MDKTFLRFELAMRGNEGNGFFEFRAVSVLQSQGLLFKLKIRLFSDVAAHLSWICVQKIERN